MTVYRLDAQRKRLIVDFDGKKTKWTFVNEKNGKIIKQGEGKIILKKKRDVYYWESEGGFYFGAVAIGNSKSINKLLGEYRF